MSIIGDIKNKYNHMSSEQLLERAKECYNELLPIFNSLDKRGNGKPYVAVFMGTALAADGKLSNAEYEFVSKLLSMSYEDACAFVSKHLGEKAASISDRIFDSCTEELKETLLDFCLCFLAVDNTITAEETEFIARLLA